MAEILMDDESKMVEPVPYLEMLGWFDTEQGEPILEDPVDKALERIIDHGSAVAFLTIMAGQIASDPELIRQTKNKNIDLSDPINRYNEALKTIEERAKTGLKPVLNANGVIVGEPHPEYAQYLDIWQKAAEAAKSQILD